MTTLGYCEVIPDQITTIRWKFINVNIGAAQSTLQDIKLPETSGGYEYSTSNDLTSPCRSRFIYWRIKQDILELIEQSLDCNLSGGYVQFRFQDTPILEGGISIHETREHVVILVATVASIHRLIFPHPRKMSFTDFSTLHAEKTLPSIFCEASVNMTRDRQNFHVINHSTSGVPLPHTAASWLSPDGEAYFSLANTTSGSILFVHMASMKNEGSVMTYELKQASVMKRLWSGLVPSVIRGSQDQVESALSLSIHPIDDGNEVYVFALCRDSKLRMWSCQSQECVLTADIVVPTSSETSNRHCLQIGAQKHMMRKCMGIDANGSVALTIAAFMCFSDRKLFCLLSPSKNTVSYNVKTLSTLHVPDWDLIDFSLTRNQLWAIWSSYDSQPIVKYISYDTSNNQSIVGNWSDVCLEPSLSREPYLADGLQDPREAYLKQLFYTSRFSTTNINKAINIFRRSADSSLISSEIPPHALFQEVVNVIENQIKLQTSDYELDDEEYQEIQHNVWAKFYSCCVEYHEVGTKATGIAAFENVGISCIVKKDLFSILRPVDIVEHLIQSSVTQADAKIMSCTSILSHDVSVYEALLNVVSCLKLISLRVNDEVKEAFQQDIYHLQNPQTVAQTVITSILCPSKNDGPTTLVSEIKRFQSTSSFVSGITALLHILDIPESQVSVMNVDEKTNGWLTNNQWLWSNVGVSCLCNSIEQMSVVRFDVCRDLLFLQLILLHSTDYFQLSTSDVNKLQSETIPKSALFVHAYYLLMWACRTQADSSLSNNSMIGLQQLSVLDLGNGQRLQKAEHESMTILELYFREEGGKQARTDMNGINKPNRMSLASIFIPLMKNVCCLIWPISVDFTFAEFLMVHFQYLQLQEYIRLLKSWCEWNNSSRKFLLGYSLLNQGEHDKAVDCFIIAAEGVSSDRFLYEKLLQTDNGDHCQLIVLYYLKVIRLLEQFHVSDQILSVASVAIGIAETDGLNMATLLSITFKYHLELGHYNEAYAAMNSNPDPSRRRDCLRQLIVVLCDRKQLKTLVGFSYGDLHDDAVSIMESKARSVDITQHNYYDVLYSFQIFRGNYRRAGSIMYEYGMRLGYEVSGVKGLQKQAKCYLTAINTLSLVDPKYAWIIKPLPVDNSSLKVTIGSRSPKRNFDGDELLISDSKRKIEVLELSDICREYEHVTAILHLFRKTQDFTITAGSLMMPSETVSLLANEGLFDMAIRLCLAYKLPLNSVFEGLTSRCVKLTQKMNDLNISEMSYEWEWLACNEINEPSSSNLSVVEQCWYLLELYLKIHEKKSSSVYHRCIANKLLSLGFSLPVWLTSSYKKRNVSELLRLYLCYDQLDDAGCLALDYLDAILGKGQEYFGLNTTLSAVNPPVWLPYTMLDQLMSLLEQMQSDVFLSHVFNELKDKLSSYHQTVSRVSDDMIKHSNLLH